MREQQEESEEEGRGVSRRYGQPDACEPEKFWQQEQVDDNAGEVAGK